jgi:L-threonylcarbamoyladenylate synthase
MISPSSADILRAADLLRQGGLVAFPTETVYGLGANALDERAVRLIYEVKGRPPTSPLIVHVDSIAMAESLSSRWPDEANVLARRWWPGPLTIVVPKDAIVPSVVTAGLNTVAIRMPSHPVALALIRAARLPLAAPSANRFGELSPTTAAHVRRGLGDRVAMILDGGPCTVGIESTVVSLAGPEPVLLRPGMISPASIEATLSKPLGRSIQPASADLSPGMQPRHYSPHTLLLLLPATLPPGRGRTVPHHEMPAHPAAYAAALYGVLHRLDEEGWDWIAIEPPPDTPEWAAILDRLRRAAAPNPVQ